jgi:hypothetical protein
MPVFWALTAVLVLVAYLPWISLVTPRLFGV